MTAILQYQQYHYITNHLQSMTNLCQVYISFTSSAPCSYVCFHVLLFGDFGNSSFFHSVHLKALGFFSPCNLDLKEPYLSQLQNNPNHMGLSKPQLHHLLSELQYLLLQLQHYAVQVHAQLLQLPSQLPQPFDSV